MTSRLGTISSIHSTPSRVSRRRSTPADTSAPISGVSGWPAHSTSWTDGAQRGAALGGGGGRPPAARAAGEKKKAARGPRALGGAVHTPPLPRFRAVLL